MLSKILGTIWILLGLLWLVKPGMLQRRLQKKMSRTMRRTVFFFSLVFSFMMMGSALKVPGIMSKIVAIVGLLLAIKVIMLITSKTSEKVFDWLGGRSLIFFRAVALFIVTIGVIMVFM